MKTVKFYTLGCKVNQYDTQLIRERLLANKVKEACAGKKADIYIINTCTVTHRADADSLHFIRRAAGENPKARILVTGCLAALDAEKIRRSQAGALIVKDKERISDFLFSRSSPTRKLANLPTAKGISYFKGHTRAFLKIQDGCDNFCSYCLVPLARGRSRSKPLSEIIQEARQLAENGFKEIVLTGVCLGAYGRDSDPKSTLVEVIAALEEIAGLARIRLSSIEAGDLSSQLIEAMQGSRKLCRHLHIPVQSGDDEILKRMNRKYLRKDYLALVSKIRKRIPAVAITTDCLVGFPGESEENFQNTVELIKRIRPLRVHLFPYSRRPGTEAAGYSKYEIGAAALQKRIMCLKAVAGQCANDYKKRFLNKKMPVLVESRCKNSSLDWEGYTDNYIRVLVRSKRDLKNELIMLRLNRMNGEFMQGDFC